MEIKKLVLVLIMGMFLISCVSAMTLDNWKNYNESTKEIIVKNTFNLGNEIAKIKLNSPLIVKVPRGYQKVAEFDLEYFLDDNGALDKIKFYNIKKNMEETERQFDFKIKTTKQEKIDDYNCNEILNKNGTKEENCEKNGYHYKEKITWEDFDFSKLNKNEKVTIGIFTDVKSGDKVEWIPEFFGVKINEWASWEEDWSVGNVFYLPLNESSGNAIDNTGNGYDFAVTGADYGATGIIGDCYNFDRSASDYLVDNITDAMSSPDAWTISMWFNIDYVVTSPENWGLWGLSSNVNGMYAVNSEVMRFYTNVGGGSWFDIAQPNEGINDTWIYVVYRYENGVGSKFDWFNLTTQLGDYENVSHSSLYPGTNFYIGSYGDASRDFDGQIDEVSLWNRSLSDTEVLDLWENYILGCGFMDDSCLGRAKPEVTLNYPENYYNSTAEEIIFNCTASDDLNLDNVTFYLNGIVNETNSSGINNSNYIFTRNLIDGNYNWTCSGTDNESQTTTASLRYFKIDTTSPVINNLTANVTGEIFGYPNSVKIQDNIIDINLENCWYYLSYNETNVSFTCNSGFVISNLREGNSVAYVFTNDSFGWVSNDSINLNIDYFTHSVTYNDSINTTESLSPTCEFLGINEKGSLHKFDIHNTTERNVSCYLFGYSNFNFTLDESNKTNQSVSVSPVMLNITFDETTNASMTWLGGSLTFENVDNITMPIRGIEETGNIQISFNEDTQLFSFYNDGDTSVSAELHLEEVDFDQPVKVLASSQEVKDALVKFYKDNKLTYSAFTDINGVVHILINDGTTYEIHVEKSGYDDYEELKYIPTSNTDTIIINLIPEEGNEGDYYFASGCLGVIGIERNCSFYVKSYKDTNITFNYTWAGESYSVTSSGSEATLTLIANSTTTPIYVTASVNPTKNYAVLWEDLTNRSITLDIDEDAIKEESNGVLGLFYAILLIIGILIMVSVNNIKKMQGKGVWGMIVWFGIMAPKFPLLWFIVTPTIIYGIFKVFWGSDE